MSFSFQCRSCSAHEGNVILDLGLQPLANSLLHQEDLSKPEPKFPLRLAVCRSCSLLQITDIVPPEQLFSQYLYFSSFSDELLYHARTAAERYIRDFHLGADNLVIEIASNDGYLLKNFLKRRIPCLGIEPAANIAQVSREQGIDTLVAFFNLSLAQKMASTQRRGDLILGNNVFAHVPDPNDFVAGLQQLLKPNGRVVLEFPYAVDLIEKVEFDTIYHEHVFYFTLLALVPLFHRHGLSIDHVERLPIHGGSLRLFAGHEGVHPTSQSVIQLLEEERRKGLDSLPFYEGFGAKVLGIKNQLRNTLWEFKRQGKSIAAYGASAKGSTLLNFLQLGAETIDFVADRSIYKQGRLTPGTHLPILRAESLLEKKPDYTLLLTWNFADEIFQQQAEYRQHGGKFVIPMPEVKVV